MIKVGIIGGSGYTGLELIKLLLNHPKTEIGFVSSRQYKGKSVQEVFPAFINSAFKGQFCDPASIPNLNEADLVFTALPHKSSLETVPSLLDKGLKVIDLSADFRLRKIADYESYYGAHTASDLLKEAVYGVPELHRDKIKTATLVANPGCYAITSILGLAPMADNSHLNSMVIIDAKSGVSGAGRTPSVETSFVETNENFRPYKVATHRHIPEIEQELGLLSGSKDIRVTFVPHLLPLNRGILATMYMPSGGLTEEEVYDIYKTFYKEEPFIRLLPRDKLPNLSYVRGSNYCDISLKLDTRSGNIIIMAAIDNLGKGASSNAIQNLNLLFGLPETTGLLPPLYP